MLSSPYAQAALVLTPLCWGWWSNEGWWDLVIAVSPSLLGFTLGAFGLIMATASDRFGQILSKAREYGGSPLDAPLAKLGGAFVVFFVLQFLSILLAILAKAAYALDAPPFASFLSEPIIVHGFWAIGGFVAIYALTTSVATIEWMFVLLVQLVRVNKAAFEDERRQPGPKEPDAPKPPKD